MTSYRSTGIVAIALLLGACGSADRSPVLQVDSSPYDYVPDIEAGDLATSEGTSERTNPSDLGGPDGFPGDLDIGEKELEQNDVDDAGPDSAIPDTVQDIETGEGVADLLEDAEQDTCVPDCIGKGCGSDGCGGVCGECPEWMECIGGACACPGSGVECEGLCCDEGAVCVNMGCCYPNCSDVECGDDGCGGECGKCGSGFICTQERKCECAFDICGESCCISGQVCTPTGCCETQCEGKQCGGDGCGYDCGKCTSYEKCNPEGLCECEFLKCGPACCEEGAICLLGGGCCKPDCTGKVCGEDGCGGSCGVCDAGCVCSLGQCIGSCGPCIPDCLGKQCGGDGCGGSCGSCPQGATCNTTTWKCDPGKCKLPTSFAGHGMKINYLKAGQSGKAGEGLDVDNNLDTCAPVGDCELGIDNQFANFLKSLSMFIGDAEPLVEAVENGDLTVLYEFIDIKTDGSAFHLNIYDGQAVLPKTECNFQVQLCDYLLSKESFDSATCLPASPFDNCQLVGDQLACGGPKYRFFFPFVLGLGDGQPFMLPSSHAHIRAEVTFDEQGTMVGLQGLIGCAVKKTEILNIANLIPPNELPVDKSIIITLLDMIAKPDIDADGDGVKESVSAAMKFKAIRGNLVGLMSN